MYQSFSVWFIIGLKECIGRNLKTVMFSESKASCTCYFTDLPQEWLKCFSKFWGIEKAVEYLFLNLHSKDFFWSSPSMNLKNERKSSRHRWRFIPGDSNLRAAKNLQTKQLDAYYFICRFAMFQNRLSCFLTVRWITIIVGKCKNHDELLFDQQMSEVFWIIKESRNEIMNETS